MLISFIVCSNGYGHIKRVVSVVNAINDINKNINSAIFINRTHVDFLSENSNFKINHPERVFLNCDFSEFEPLWNENLCFVSYENWNKKLLENKLLNKSKLIISDNYISPLNFFDNVILMGSFLWIDIENKAKDIKNIINYENNLLMNKKPLMLCHKDLAMQSVITKTRPIKLPWFCTKKSKFLNFEKKTGVLFTGGGTKNNNNLIIKLIEEICPLINNYEIYLDKNIYSSFKNKYLKYVKEFDFSDNSFSSLKYIVCRPGVGILTECIKFDIVPITLDFNDNVEMKFNSNVIVRLNIGFSIVMSNKINKKSIELLNYIDDNESYSFFLKNIKKQPDSGEIEAAKKILSII